MPEAAISHTAARLARLYPTRFLRHYTYWKIRTDPLYPAVWECLSTSPRQLPVLDLGCGAGLLAFFLRAHGFSAPIHGVDIDAGKIAVASDLARHHEPPPTFSVGDFRHLEGPSPGHVTLLDVLQYIPQKQQAEVIAAAASSVAPDGGRLIIRSGLRDSSWRSRFSHVSDHFARWVRWMKTPPVESPDRETLARTLAGLGLSVRLSPLWGATPFNNYLIIATRQ